MSPIEQLEKISIDNGRVGWSFVATGENNELDEAARLFTLTSDRHKVYVKSTLRRLADVATKSKDTESKPGEREIARFLRLVDLIHQVPWANKSFEPNEKIIRQLMCGHLELIVGQAVAKAHGNRLRQLIDSEAKDSHLVWVTNRQQGKTTTMAKFLAALSIASPRGGNLVFVYSTSLDRAGGYFVPVFFNRNPPLTPSSPASLPGPRGTARRQEHHSPPHEGEKTPVPRLPQRAHHTGQRDNVRDFHARYGKRGARTPAEHCLVSW